VESHPAPLRDGGGGRPHPFWDAVPGLLAVALILLVYSAISAPPVGNQLRGMNRPANRKTTVLPGVVQYPVFQVQRTARRAPCAPGRGLLDQSATWSRCDTRTTFLLDDRTFVQKLRHVVAVAPINLTPR